MEVNEVGRTVRIDCPAKLNLFLEVLARRSDGFHEIETLLVAISLYDSLVITAVEEARIQVSCEWATGLEAWQVHRGDPTLTSLPSAQDNLVYRAAERLQNRAGVALGATIQLVKRIPMEAGLGGASSDAAATLLALNRVWRLGWSRSQLLPLAAELGSDVPFFLLNRREGSQAAIGRGRGEKLTQVERLPRLSLVLAKPTTGLSTAAVYQRCRAPREPVAVEPLIAALRTGSSSVGKLIFNRLQEVGEELSPQVATARRICEQMDVVGHAMTGSGSSYYAVCRSATQARHLSARLRMVLPGQVFHASTI
jgi:4-diphosphocytidyl-2-C-methyl-D-erythritol kinase